jgi:hypothetical protein
MNGYILENQVTLALLVTYAHQHLTKQPTGRKMKDKNGHYSSDVLVLGVCLFELSFFFFFLPSSRSTVSSLFYRINALAAIVDKRMHRCRHACSL